MRRYIYTYTHTHMCTRAHALTYIPTLMGGKGKFDDSREKPNGVPKLVSKDKELD